MPYESEDKLVSHPDHYISGGMEAIDVIEAFTDGLNGIEATDTGNVIKYILRWKKKDGVRDLEKALWYLTHLISKVKVNKEESAEGEFTYPDMQSFTEPMTFTFTCKLDKEGDNNE